MYKLFSLLLFISGYIPEYMLLEVNSGNCLSNTVLTSLCKFSIKIYAPLETDLMCQLRFTYTNVTTAVLVNNGSILSSQIGNSCPSIQFIINNGANNEFSENCNKRIVFYNHSFTDFTFAKFIYSNYGVKDLTTNINMEIYLLGLRDCIEVPPAQSSSSKIIWIIIIICALILIVIIAIIIAIDCMKKHPQKNANPQQLASTPTRDSKDEIKQEDKDQIPESRPMINETSA